MASITSLQIRFLLVLTCMVSVHIVESLEPIPGQPLLQFSPDQAYKQKFLLQYWKDCHDAWLHTGGCLVDILKLLHGGVFGGLPGGGGGLPLGNPPAADAPAAAAPSGGSPAADTAETLLDGADAAAAGGGGGGFPDIGSWFPGLGSGGLPGLGGGIPGLGGGIPGIGGGIPGIGGGAPGVGGGIPGIGGGLPGFGGPFSTVCCDALAGVQKSCPGLAINPFYGPLVSKHCAAH